MSKKKAFLVGKQSGKKISPTLLQRLGLDPNDLDNSSGFEVVNEDDSQEKGYEVEGEQLDLFYEDSPKANEHTISELQQDLDYEMDSESMDYEVDDTHVEPSFYSDAKDEYREVSIYDLIPNDENKSIYLEIEDQPSFNQLKQSIKEIGLIEPIVCQDTNKNSQYIIISGHRRHSALLELYKEGHQQFSTTKIKIARSTKKENITQTMLDANNSTREISEYSKMVSVIKYAEIYQEKKKRKEIPVGLTEKKFVSDRMNIGERQIAKYLFMYKKIESSILEEVVNNNEVSLNKLYERMDKLRKQDIDITELTIDDFLNNGKPKRDKSTTIIEMEISTKTKNMVKRFSKDLSKTFDVGKGITQANDLDEKSKKRISNLLKRIEKEINELYLLLGDDEKNGST